MAREVVTMTYFKMEVVELQVSWLSRTLVHLYEGSVPTLASRYWLREFTTNFSAPITLVGTWTEYLKIQGLELSFPVKIRLVWAVHSPVNSNEFKIKWLILFTTYLLLLAQRHNAKAAECSSLVFPSHGLLPQVITNQPTLSKRSFQFRMRCCWAYVYRMFNGCYVLSAHQSYECRQHLQ
jgi:hypothetical protein